MISSNAFDAAHYNQFFDLITDPGQAWRNVEYDTAGIRTHISSVAQQAEQGVVTWSNHPTQAKAKRPISHLETRAVYTPRISSCEIASSILTRPTSAAQSKNLVV